MNVSLTPALERFIRDKVASGLYNNASEVVREALRLLHGKLGNEGAPRRAEVTAAILRYEPRLRDRGIRALHLFGSVARDEAKPGSDVDVLIELAPGAHLDLLDHAALQTELTERVGHHVDVVRKESLRRELRSAVLSEAVRVF